MIQQKMKNDNANTTVNAASTVNNTNTSVPLTTNFASDSISDVPIPLEKRKRVQTDRPSLSKKKKNI
jgi:hypothetical protein